MSGSYQPKSPTPTAEELLQLYPEDREDELAKLDPSTALALRCELDGLENPATSQLNDHAIAEARIMEEAHEQEFDDRSACSGGYVNAVISEGLASGDLLERIPEETLPELAARLEAEATAKAKAEETFRINQLVDRAVAASLSEFSRRFSGGR